MLLEEGLRRFLLSDPRITALVRKVYPNKAPMNPEDGIPDPIIVFQQESREPNHLLVPGKSGMVNRHYFINVICADYDKGKYAAEAIYDAIDQVKNPFVPVNLCILEDQKDEYNDEAQLHVVISTYKIISTVQRL